MGQRIQLTRAESAGMDIQPPCFYCRNLTNIGNQRNDAAPLVSLDGWTCKAFPEGIPKDILEREVRHDNPQEPDLGQVDEVTFYDPKVEMFTAGPAVMSFDGYWEEVEN